MSNQEFEETQDFDEQDTGSADGETSNENEEGGDDNNTSNKNKSNFKNLYKKAKELERTVEERTRTLEEREEELARLQEELQEWRDLNPEVLEDLKANKSMTSLEEKIFVLENPETKPYLKEIRDTMKEYGVTHEKAWKLVKVDLPEESITKKDFDIGTKGKPKNIDLSKVSLEESADLTPEQRKEWRKVHGWV